MEEFEFEFETSEEEEEEERRRRTVMMMLMLGTPDQAPWPGYPGFRERVSDLATDGKRRAVIKEFIG